MMSLRQNEEEKKQWEEEKRIAGTCTSFKNMNKYRNHGNPCHGGKKTYTQ